MIYWLMENGVWGKISKDLYDKYTTYFAAPQWIALYGDTSHLIKVTRNQNMPNRRKNSSSLYKGVTKIGKRFQARFEGKSFGYYDQRDDAARAYDKAAKDKYGDEAVLNFPIDTSTQ